MLRHRIAFVLVAMTLAGCHDAPILGPDPVALPWPPTAPSVLTLTGSIELDGGQITLCTGDGSRVPLLGPEAQRLHRAVGAVVVVRATDDAVGGFLVASFTVLEVNGVAAIDGVLKVGPLPGTAGSGGYYLLLADGSTRLLMDPPPELREHGGARMWVTGGVSIPVIAFGLLE